MFLSLCFSFDIVTVRDAAGNQFATRLNNIFVLGTGEKSLISLPKGDGIKLTIQQQLTAKQLRK